MTDRRLRQALMATNQDGRAVEGALRSNIVPVNAGNEPRHADETLLMMPAR